jgi:hypothetical protein
MPLDGVSPHFLARARLIDALRDLPSTHEWDFKMGFAHKDCGTLGCAMGLAVAIGLLRDTEIYAGFSSLANMAVVLGLSSESLRPIFNPDQENFRPFRIFHGPFMGLTYDDVTPEMVADELEKL